MGKYDFSVLSPDEFELFCKDLLEVDRNIKLEHFKSGKDGGIDLRYAPNIDENLIVQCKRYADFKPLKQCLKKEVKKVELLNPTPTRYIIMTTVRLNPDEKNIIKDIFGEYIKSSSDIIGGDELQSMLVNNEKVERKHYKLWLASTNVLQSIVNNDILNQSSFDEEEIKEKIKIYVPNQYFLEALKELSDNRVIILSGSPGVGKTTFGDMLSLHFLAKGYSFISLSENISSADKIYTSGIKQIFYYDDFLGRNFLDNKLTKNEDKRILNFINKVSKSSDKLFIMTTREYILNQAQQKHDLLTSEKININKYVVDVEKYTFNLKAKILYNHLYFSTLPEEYIQELIFQKSYKKIINHRNYNPRIIQLMTQESVIDNILPKDYVKEFMQKLEFPEAIWEHAYENHINEYSQYILQLLMIMGDNDILLNNLEENYYSLNKYLGNKFSHLDFKKGIKELERTFINIYSRYNNKLYVKFQNPSIADFLIRYSQSDIRNIITLWNSTLYFEPMFKVFSFSYEKGKIEIPKENHNEYIATIFNRFFDFVESKDIEGQVNILSKLDREIDSKPLIDLNKPMIKDILIKVYRQNDIPYYLEEYIELLIKYKYILEEETDLDLICIHLIDDTEYASELISLVDFCKSFPNVMDKHKINESIEDILYRVVSKTKEEMSEDIDAFDFAEEAINSVGELFNLEITEYINELEVAHDEIKEESDFLDFNREYADWLGKEDEQKQNEDLEIDDLFMTLLK